MTDDKEGKKAQEAHEGKRNSGGKPSDKAATTTKPAAPSQPEPTAPVVERPAQPVPLSPEQVERVLKLSEKECAAFYKMMIVIATTFLGGTLGFIEKIVPHPIRGSVWLLGLGWLGLVLSILGIVWVRRFNIEAFHAYLRYDYDRSDALQVRGRKFMDGAGGLLSGGLLFLMCFGFVNFLNGNDAVPSKEKSVEAVLQGGAAAGPDRGNVSLDPPSQHQRAVPTANPPADAPPASANTTSKANAAVHSSAAPEMKP